MLWQISRSPGLLFSIFAGVVCIVDFQPRHSRESERERSHLGVLAAFKEGRDAHETDVIVPHHSILAIIAWDFERVLKHYVGMKLAAVFLRECRNSSNLYEPSKLSLPVFSKNDFFSLL